MQSLHRMARGEGGGGETFRAHMPRLQARSTHALELFITADVGLAERAWPLLYPVRVVSGMRVWPLLLCDRSDRAESRSRKAHPSELGGVYVSVVGHEQSGARPRLWMPHCFTHTLHMRD